VLKLIKGLTLTFSPAFLFYGQHRMFRKVMSAHAIFFLVLGKINNVLPGLLPGSTLQKTTLSMYFSHC